MVTVKGGLKALGICAIIFGGILCLNGLTPIPMMGMMGTSYTTMYIILLWEFLYLIPGSLLIFIGIILINKREYFDKKIKSFQAKKV